MVSAPVKLTIVKPQNSPKATKTQNLKVQAKKSENNELSDEELALLV